MSASRVKHARPVWRKSLLLGVVVLSVSGLALSASAQVTESLSALPDAPSSNSPSRGVPVTAGSTTDHSLTLSERADIYARSIFSFESILVPAFAAGIDQARDEPPGWRGGAEGYGKRFGSAAARLTISETIRFGFAAVDGEDPRYVRSEKRGIWARTQHAVASTFVSKTSSGATIPAFSRLAGAYSAAFIANTWYPDNRATAGDAAMRGTASLAGTIGIHLLREFTPFFRGTR